MPDPLPYATPDVLGVGGTLRSRPEDFFVQELPLYDPTGDGHHIYFEAQKVDLTTREAVSRIAKALGMRPRDVGYAGLKDRRAVARQLFSVPAERGVDEERVMRLEIDGIAPQWAARHGNKLRTGHLAGNRFAIRIRDVNPTDVVRLRPVLDRITQTGLPNYYGEQRFGVDRSRPNDVLGLALLRRDFQGFCDLFLGGEDNRPDVAEARRLYDSGDRAAALEAWPRNIVAELRVLRTLAETGDPERAAAKVDLKIRRLYESAAQSTVFNQVVADRLQDGLLSTLVTGDVAVKHTDELRTGGMFIVDDPAVEQPRCDAWEISPTAALPGGRLHPKACAIAVERETAAMAKLGVSPADFDAMPGAHRPVRVRPIDTRLSAGVDDDGPHIVVAFTLPAGSFATVLLRELMKVE